jgi:hypothetical protein
VKCARVQGLQDLLVCTKCWKLPERAS